MDRDFKPHEPPAGPWTTEVYNATVYGIVSLVEPIGLGISITLPQAGFGLHAAADGVLDARSTIISDVSHIGAGASEEGGRGSVSYCDIWRAETPLDGFADAIPSTLSVDPRFLDAERGNFGLHPESECIDAGDPVAPCLEEPLPDEGDCRVDQGHLGNTPEARSL